MHGSDSTDMCMDAYSIGRKREDNEIKPFHYSDMEKANVIENSYFITSHQPQISQRFAALCNQGGSLVCNFFTPSDIYRLYGHAVAPNGYQCCGREKAHVLAASGIPILF